MIRNFFVPGQPQGKGRAKVSTRGGFARAYTPEKTVAYESLIKAQYAAMYPDALPCANEIHMSIIAWFEIPKSASKVQRGRMVCHEVGPTKKPDADNIAKVICDALNGIAYRDDTQIINLHISKRYSEKPGVDVWITDERKEAEHGA
jgi:Holliday junction resolvase RusA-like endonuclease